MLAGVLELHNVKDVEALCRKVADDRLRQFGSHGLNRVDYDDLITFLIAQCWELGVRYDPSRDRNPNFGSYAARILSLRVADWFRQRFGDTRHGERPVVLSLDAPATLSGGEGDGQGLEAGRDRLVDTLASVTGDPALDCVPDLVGVLQRRDRPENRADDKVAQPQTRGAARGDRSPAHVKPRVPPTTTKKAVEPPTCQHCFSIFVKAFKRANKSLPADKRLSDDEILERARARGAAVKFAGEWVCTRCTTLPSPDGLGGVVFFYELYPNRAARRAAKAKPRKTKRKVA